MKQKITLLLVLVLLFSAASFGRVLAAETYNPKIDPANFSTNISNKYFPLSPGTTYDYKNKTSEGTETNKTIVTNLAREVMGVRTVVVWDRVWLDGNLIEETYDWYAQDKTGNVWYFGEESREYENGKVKSTHGSWEGGINGALPGIIMEANPKVGDSYKQEYYKGEAEDQSDVLALNQKVTVPAGTYSDCLKTADYTMLAIQKKETKYYCTSAGGLTLTITDASGEKDELLSKKTNVDFVSLSSSSQPASSQPAAKAESKTLWIIGAGLIGLALGAAAGRFMRAKPQTVSQTDTKEDVSV